MKLFFSSVDTCQFYWNVVVKNKCARVWERKRNTKCQSTIEMFLWCFFLVRIQVAYTEIWVNSFLILKRMSKFQLIHFKIEIFTIDKRFIISIDYCQFISVSCIRMFIEQLFMFINRVFIYLYVVHESLMCH